MDATRRFEGGFLLTNAYLVATPGGGHVLIDAPADTDLWLDELRITPLALLLTHQHFDHVMSAAAISARGVPVHAWSEFSRELTCEQIVRQWGMPFDVEEFPVDHRLDGLQQVEIDGLILELAHVPGHSPDSVTFHDTGGENLYSGDTLFAGSTGRGDLPGGDLELLCRGIVEKIYTLPGSTRVHPGHGDATDIATERLSNSVVRIAT